MAQPTSCPTGYQCLSLAADQALGAGLYQIYGTFRASAITKEQLQQDLRQRFNRGDIDVLDWNNSVVRFRVGETVTAAPQTEGIMQPAWVVPLLLTIGSIVAALTVWRVVIEIKETMQLVPAPVRGAIGVGVATATTGLGLLLGAIAVVWVWRAWRNSPTAQQGRAA